MTLIFVYVFVRVCVCVGVGVGAGRWCACAHVALLIQHATRHHIAICGLSGPTSFFHILINGKIFGKSS